MMQELQEKGKVSPVPAGALVGPGSPHSAVKILSEGPFEAQNRGKVMRQAGIIVLEFTLAMLFD